MSSSNLKNDDGVPPLYRQARSLSKVGYFNIAHFKISFDDLFKDFLEAYWHAIPLGVRVKRVKDGSSHEPCDGAQRAIKFHPYYFVRAYFSYVAFLSRSALIHEMCPCPMFFECGPCDGGIPRLKPIL
ncbi:hypothetical protein EV2_006995 [Malus domestica]